MFNFRWLKSGVLIFILFSCNKPLPTLEKIDLQAWKDDKNACSGKRTSMLDGMNSQTAKLVGLSEQEVIAMLGRPDQNELYKRNQKFYSYFIQPSNVCSGSVTDHPKKLVIRFNAIGLAKEVGVE
jgi:hypothetical protein